MSAVLARLHLLLAAAMDAAREDGAEGQVPGGAADRGYSRRCGDSEADLNGSFRGVGLEELLPVMAAAQRVAACAAGLVGKGLGMG